MSKIKCNQEKCKYNASKYCIKSGIYVDEHANCDSDEEEKKLDNSKFEFGTFERLEKQNADRAERELEDEIIKMFDRLTEEHSYYPECSKNRHLFDGWKTNKAHKIAGKVIAVRQATGT